MVTAEGVFKIVDAATRPIKSIGSAASETMAKVTGAGDALDDLDSPKIIGSIQTAKTEVEGVGKKAEEMAVKVAASTDKAGRNFEKMAAKGTASIEELQLKLKEFEHERATATLDVNITKAEAKIRLIKEQIRSVSTSQARQELQSMGLMADRATSSLIGGGAGGGGPPGTRGGGGMMGGLAGAAKAVFSSVGMMGAGIAAALPAVMDLTGALSALIGSAGQAALGAGALGVGGFGATAVGLGSILAVAKPAMTGLKTVTAAQKAYNTAVTQYGDKSRQAIQAHKKLDAAYAANPGTKALLQNWTMFKKEFQSATAPGRKDFFGIMNDGIRTMHSLLPTLGPLINANIGAMRTGFSDFFKSFQSPEWRQIFTSMSSTFQRGMQPVSDAMANIALFFGRIARAASPALLQMLQSFDTWTQHLSSRAADTQQMTTKIEGMTSQLKDWIKFFGAAIRLAGAFFGSGAQQGQTMLEGITKQLDKWTAWIRTHPQQMHAFFQRTIQGAKQLVSALGTIASAIGKIADQLGPVLNMFTSLVSTIGGNATATLLTGGAEGFLGYKGAKGFFKGRGGAPAAGAAGGGSAGLTGVAAAAAMGGGSRAERDALRAARIAGPGRAAAATESDALALVMGGARGGRTLGAVGKVGGMAGRIGGRFLLPLLLANMFMQGATSPGGFGGHLQGAAAALDPTYLIPGAPHIIPMPHAKESPQAAYAKQVTQIQSQLPTMSNAVLRRNIGIAQRNVGTAQAAVAQTQHLVSVHQASPKDVADAEAQLRRYDSIFKTYQDSWNQRSRSSSDRIFQDLSGAFDINERARGPKAAMRIFTRDMTTELHKMGPAGRDEMLKNSAMWEAQLEHGNSKQKAQARGLRKYIVDQYKAIGENVAIVNGEIIPATDAAWKRIQQSMSSYTERAAEDVSTNLTAVQNKALAVLIAFGFSKGDATSLLKQAEGGNKNTQQRGAARAALQSHNPSNYNVGIAKGTKSGPPTPTHATGGRVGGHGLTDHVPLGASAIAAPGELLILNRHTEAKLDRKLGFPGATAMFANTETLPHSATPRGLYARGGKVGASIAGAAGGAVNWSGHPPLSGGIAGATADVLSKFPLVVTATKDGSHVSGSYHYKGEAVDISGPDAVMYNAAQWIKSSGLSRSLTEGIHNPNLSINAGHPVPSSFYSAVWAGHRNHIHMAVAGKLGAVGAGSLGPGGFGGAVPTIDPKQLFPPKSNQRGFAGPLVDTIGEITSAAYAKRLNPLIAAKAPGGGISAGAFAGQGGSNSANQALGRKMMMAAGWPGSEWPSLRALWTQESGWDANSVNKSSGAYGIPQALGHGHPFNLGDAPAQIAWGLNYIRQRYGSPSKAEAHERAFNWYATGGRVPEFAGAFATGGAFTTSGPTMALAGERTGRPRERVTITPLTTHRAGPGRIGGEEGGGSPVVHVSIGHITNHEKGDIQEIVQRELSAVAAGLSNGDGDELG